MNNDLQGQDMIRWMDNLTDPPVERHGTVLVALSVQYLVVDSEGRETFVMKKEAYADPRVKKQSRRRISGHEEGAGDSPHNGIVPADAGPSDAVGSDDGGANDSVAL